MTTVGFSPDGYANDPERQSQVQECLNKNDLRQAIILAFNLLPSDSYIYRAVAEVTLSQVQSGVNAGSANNLHRWYISSDNESLGNPSQADIEAYIALFSPSTQAAKTLKALESNAKKGSLRASIAAYLSSKRYLDAKRFQIPRRKSPHFNPALTFWSWSCRNLEWGGPSPESIRSHISHPMLPVFMHHFGCVAPSWEALEIIRILATTPQSPNDAKSVKAGGGAGKPGQLRSVLDIGSGNGYWTYMLRRHGLTVHAVDNAQSLFRTSWIPDTVRADGAAYLRNRASSTPHNRGVDDILLLVYPVVGADFTRTMLGAFAGGAVVVAGTQNANGYTGFRDMTMDQFVEKELGDKGWRRTAQVPLPSFAGKDEALFVFERDRSLPSK